jgi:hypothetical protein
MSKNIDKFCLSTFDQVTEDAVELSTMNCCHHMMSVKFTLEQAMMEAQRLSTVIDILFL